LRSRYTTRWGIEQGHAVRVCHQGQGCVVDKVGENPAVVGQVMVGQARRAVAERGELAVNSGVGGHCLGRPRHVGEEVRENG